MNCNERGHRALEQALETMRQERNSLTSKVKSLHGNVIGLESNLAAARERIHELEVQVRSLEIVKDNIRSSLQSALDLLHQEEGA
jgi:predicted  nucleic acid-binding Zn-ribbon protein